MVPSSYCNRVKNLLDDSILRPVAVVGRRLRSDEAARAAVSTDAQVDVRIEGDLRSGTAPTARTDRPLRMIRRIKDALKTH